MMQREPEDSGMYGFILSFGEYAEVLEPEHIRSIISGAWVRFFRENRNILPILQSERLIMRDGVVLLGETFILHLVLD